MLITFGSERVNCLRIKQKNKKEKEREECLFGLGCLLWILNVSCGGDFKKSPKESLQSKPTAQKVWSWIMIGWYPEIIAMSVVVTNCRVCLDTHWPLRGAEVLLEVLIFMGSRVFLAKSPEHPNQTLLIFWGGEYLLQFPNDGYLRLFKPSSRQWFLKKPR